MMTVFIKNVEHSNVFDLSRLVEIEENRVNSLTLSQAPAAKITVLAIAEGEGLATHAAPGDALATILEGAGQITIDGVEHRLAAGQSIVMPAGVPHSVFGAEPFKMLLVVVKGS